MTLGAAGSHGSSRVGARLRWSAGWAAVVGTLVYLPSVGGGFLYDDVRAVVENRSIRDLGALGTVLRADPARPILSLSWALNHSLGGLTPWHFHLVGVLIHAGNAALLCSLFGWMAASSRRRDAGAVALLGALLFAATPMAAETVAYVSSRSTSLSALFVLASLRLAVAGLELRSLRRHAAALGLFLLGLLTKEEAASLPLLLLLVDFYYLAERRFGSLWSRWRWHAPFILLPLLGLVGRRWVTGSWLPPAAVPRGTYLVTQVAAFPGYFVRALVPWDPAFFRGALPAPWPPDPQTVALLLAAGGLVLGGVAGLRRRPEWGFAVLWMAAGLLPSSSLVPLNEMVVDHRAYLGGAGVSLAVAFLLWRPGGLRLAAAVLALFAARALHYQWVLADPARAWEDAVRRAPRSVEARLALGEAYAGHGDPRAETALRQAVDLDRRDPRGWANLGAFLVERGRLVEASQAMRSAVSVAPGHARLRDNLGMILLALGREDEALVEFEAAAAAVPRLAQPRINLAALLLRRGESERAAALLEEAETLEVDAADAERILRLWRQVGS